MVDLFKLILGLMADLFRLRASQPVWKQRSWFCDSNVLQRLRPKRPRLSSIDRLVVCTENLNTGVVVMKSAQDGARTDHTGSLYRARDRRILVKGSVSPDAVVVASVRFQNPAQMCLAKDNDVVHTFTPDRSDQPFDKAILRG